MKQQAFTLLAFFAASVLPAVGLSVLQSGSHGAAPTVAALLPAYYPFSVAATLLIGLPGYLILKPLGGVRWWTACACGGVAGGAVIGVLAYLFPDPGIYRKLTPFGLIGATAGLLFWAIWRLGRR